MTLPTDAKQRKETPIASGVLGYFPDAIAAVAQVSFVGNQQHNPGQPLHWDRSKSTDEADALIRHFMQHGTLDSDGLRHSAKVAWRALALLQKEIEASNGLLPRGMSHDKTGVAVAGAPASDGAADTARNYAPDGCGSADNGSRRPNVGFSPPYST